ncbi:MAG: histidinol-phosphatase [Omnitrophica bacterium RIFCSPHIGHO2_02_FULL_46_11]|nr:MAG: histidinol-phosphatase [Omnitrophica bacterium RIFCSPHIGHO2_02_FULL_46_11]OGW87765.1 MAG: histidinol-phosphatase [Omnitrophica bacterium RIFCSPLOWO2_01_FULL_45_10b]
MDNKEIAQILEEIAELLEIKGENPFKIRAYHNGARVIEGLASDIAEFARSGKLREIKGIGEGLAEKITELVKTGKCKYHHELTKSLPAGILDLLQIPGLGPKRAKALFEKLKIKSVAELERACHENRLVDLDGFGEKSQAKVLEAIKHHKKTEGYFLISQAKEESEKFLQYLKKSKGISRIEVAGSIRRHKEIVHDMDILISTKRPAPIHQAFTSYPAVDQILAKGETKSSVILKSGIQADLRTVSDSEFPSALYYFTGSKEHNVATRTIAKRMGLKISEYGIFKGTKPIPCKDEEAIFKVLGLRYIPPELRENTGEIEAAKKGPLPKLIELEDIRGVFHVHSTYSDGTASLEAMIHHSEELGYEYVGISDHSKTAVYANGLSEARLEKQNKELDRLERKFKKIRIFRGIESDILADGSLDYPDRVLKKFDFVVGSIHSRFSMSEKEMTKRIARAMSHPAMTIWGHPTGRLLLGRAGYAINYDALFETAEKYGVAIELNANPHRLDLDWRFCKKPKAMGLRFSINPDAHSLDGLSDVAYGVGIARKGWLEKNDALNTMSVLEVEKYLRGRKK